MNPHFHPSDETLFAYAAGQLSEGHALITRTHLEFCDECRENVRTYETLGGMLLETLDPASLSVDAFANAVEKTAMPAPRSLRREGRPHPKFLADLDGFELPSTLRGYEIGKWRPLAPGVRFSSFRLNNDTRGMFLRAKAGSSLFAHSHQGMEYTIVLQGSFDDELGHMAKGDMTEYGDEIKHRPIVSQEGECICLFVFEGRLKIESVLGRMMQPLMGL